MDIRRRYFFAMKIKECYSTGEFAQLMGVCVKTVQRWDQNGVLRAYRYPSGRRYYTHEQYETFMKEGKARSVRTNKAHNGAKDEEGDA